MAPINIRDADEGDVPSINSIYNQYIVGSHVSFDTEPWGDAERLAWFQQRVRAGYPVVVAERNGSVIGVSWSGPWRDKAAYRRSAETTVVLDSGVTGAGVGSVLYRALLDRLSAEGFHRAYAIIALPNDASVALHRKLGFRVLGTLDEAGFKDGAFISTTLMECRLDH